ncbi:hypothetical protein ACW5R3_09105 [Bizionia sp. KMM 8389]
MTITQLPGIYKISGSNQSEDQSVYSGFLKLTLDATNRIHASWEIGGSQTQKGMGFFKDNILVINFNYRGEDNRVYKGVVVYKCLTKDVLEGFWSEKHGGPLYLGTEHGVRVDSNKF